MTRFVLATGNPNKVAELRAILGERFDGHELVAVGELAPDAPEPVEDGDSFAANALIKARAAAALTGLPALADDSGISARALGGAPGIHSARFAGTRDAVDNNRKLLTALVDSDDRAAWFSCAAALVDPADGFETVLTREWPGEILREATGEGGHGYDPVFRPVGETRSSAQLTAAEKNAISHRALAFGDLVTLLRERFG